MMVVTLFFHVYIEFLLKITYSHPMADTHTQNLIIFIGQVLWYTHYTMIHLQIDTRSSYELSFSAKKRSYNIVGANYPFVYISPTGCYFICTNILHKFHPMIRFL